MELKSVSLAELPGWMRSFNRTFMELKLDRMFRLEASISQRFNRTFMELKSVIFTVFVSDTSFNRTFMELKLQSAQRIKNHIAVLIVPLWN